MHTETIVEVELWALRVLLVYGLIAGLWFLISWWPRVAKNKRFGIAALDVGGWVAADVVMYVILLGLFVFDPTPGHAPVIVRSRFLVLLFVLITDVAITLRWLHWRRIRHDVGTPQRRTTDEPMEFT